MVRPKRSSSVKTFQEEESEGSGEESEWEQTIEGQGIEESDDAGDGNEDDAEEESKPDNIKSSEVNAKVKKAPWNKGLGKKRKRPSEYDTDNEDGEDALPTIVRKTDKGGYAHTKKSRARIGKANKGKSPWNKGKHRSEEVKAKIRAGVVARNQAILAVKLKKLGMTEGEWITKKKEIKYLRERVRRAKLAVNKKKEEMTQAYLLKLERELKDVLELRSSIDNNVSIVEYVSVLTCRVKISSLTLSLSKIVEDAEKLKEELEEELNHDKEVVTESNANVSSEEEKKDDYTECHTDNTQLLFQKEITWVPHLGHATGTPKCPKGGPGGLICCEDCSEAFSGFLTATALDAEHQIRHTVGKEVQELLGYVEECRFGIMTAVQVARKLPLPPGVATISSLRQIGQKRSILDSTPDPVEWTMTSVMDLASRGDNVSRI